VAVHVGELHTDVVTSEAPASGQPGSPSPPEWETDRRALEAMERAAWLRARVRAEGFDD
jgi:hypothetical protein